MNYVDTRRLEVISDQRTVASPPHRLRAHHRRPFVPRELEQAFNPGAKSVRLHVVGVAAKRRVAPDGVS